MNFLDPAYCDVLVAYVGRYLAICRVFEFRITRKMALTVIVFIWICAALIMSPWAVFFRQVNFDYLFNRQ